MVEIEKRSRVLTPEEQQARLKGFQARFAEVMRWEMQATPADYSLESLELTADSVIIARLALPADCRQRWTNSITMWLSTYLTTEFGQHAVVQEEEDGCHFVIKV